MKASDNLQHRKEAARAALRACVEKLEAGLDADDPGALDDAETIAEIVRSRENPELIGLLNDRASHIYRILRREIKLPDDSEQNRRTAVIDEALAGLIGLDDDVSCWSGDSLSIERRDALLCAAHSLASEVIIACNNRREALRRGESSTFSDAVLSWFVRAMGDKTVRRYLVLCALDRAAQEVRAGGNPVDAAVLAHTQLVHIEPKFARLEGDELLSQIERIARAPARGRVAYSEQLGAAHISCCVGAFGDGDATKQKTAEEVAAGRFKDARERFLGAEMPTSEVVEWSTQTRGVLTRFRALRTKLPRHLK